MIEWWLWPYGALSFGIGLGVVALVVLVSWWDSLTPLGRIAAPLVGGLIAGLIGGIVRVKP